MSGFLAVGLGALAAHSLKSRLTPELLSTFQTGVHYQMYHALALIGIAVLIKLYGRQNWLQGAAFLFIVGILLFSGSLYGLALGGPKWLGPITPMGGLSFLLGWLSLLIAALRFKH